MIVADSYDLRVPRDNLARPIRGSQLSVHEQSSSVHLQKVYAHPSDACFTNKSRETVRGIYEWSVSRRVD